MSLRIRRGTNAERLQTTLDLGEIAYTTDTKQLYVGDGVTLGGNNILSTSAGVGLAWNNDDQVLDLSTAFLSTTEVVEGTNLYFTPDRSQDATSTLFTHSDHTGISFSYDDDNNKIVAVVNTSEIDVDAEVAALFGNGVHSGITFTYEPGFHRINAVITVNQEDVQDKIAPLFTDGVHHGISFEYNDSNNVINATVNVDILPTDALGNLHNDGYGTLEWRPTTLEDDPTPKLGADLDLNYNDITGLGDISMSGNISATGRLRLGPLDDYHLDVGLSSNTLTFTTRPAEYTRISTARLYLGSTSQSSRLYLITDQEAGQNSVVFRSFNNTTPQANTIVLFRARGTAAATTAIQNGDEIYRTSYRGNDGSSTAASVVSSEIVATVDGPVSTGIVPGKIQFSTVDALGSLNPALSIDSSQTVTVSNALRVNSHFIKFPVYANATARNAAIASPEAGMVVFLTDRGSSNPGLQVNIDSTVLGWTDL